MHEECHTSAMGIREYALMKDDDVKVCNSEEAPNLFFFLAMSNCNGKKLPMKWINIINDKDKTLSS